jgi:hypothetical protein
LKNLATENYKEVLRVLGVVSTLHTPCKTMHVEKKAFLYYNTRGPHASIFFFALLQKYNAGRCENTTWWGVAFTQHPCAFIQLMLAY